MSSFTFNMEKKDTQNLCRKLSMRCHLQFPCLCDQFNIMQQYSHSSTIHQGAHPIKLHLVKIWLTFKLRHSGKYQNECTGICDPISLEIKMIYVCSLDRTELWANMTSIRAQFLLGLSVASHRLWEVKLSDKSIFPWQCDPSHKLTNRPLSVHQRRLKQELINNSIQQANTKKDKFSLRQFLSKG